MDRRIAALQNAPMPYQLRTAFLVAIALIGLVRADALAALTPATKTFSPRLAVGAAHACAVLSDGSVRCWGQNTEGELGDGTFTDRSLPVTVTTILSVFGKVSSSGAPLMNVTAVVAGDFFSCALTATGQVFCWGSNDAGQLGFANTGNVLRARLVSSLSNVVRIAAGSRHACAVMVDGSVACWGANQAGQLGVGTVSASEPVRPVAVSSEVIDITAGSLHTCVVTAIGRVSCWGSNTSGQLGNGGTAPATRPTGAAIADVVGIAAGAYHTCAITGDGTVRCWGANHAGQLGQGLFSPMSTSPITVQNLFAKAVTAGGDHTCAVSGFSTAHCWGAGASGQLGSGFVLSETSPRQVVGLINAVAVTASYVNSCALNTVGNVLCWGANDRGQLGNGTASASLTPTTVAAIAGSVSATSIDASPLSTCATRANGTLACWGGNLAGQVGDGTTTNRYLPATVPRVSNVIALAQGARHSCALQANGAVFCWGDNGYGQLGDGSTIARLTPVRVADLPPATAIAAGTFFTCAVLFDGTARCWGINDYGQLGDGTRASRGTPAPVAGVSGAVAISAGGEHVCVLTDVGTGECWGRNQFGQLGLVNDIALRITSTQVPGLFAAISLDAGTYYTCAGLADGTVRCWGDNISGQIGDGTTTPRFSPTSVIGLTDVTAVSAGGGHTCALLVDGTMRCWGKNVWGQLGDGSNLSRLIPATSPTGLTNVIGLSANGPGTIDHTCAIRSDGSAWCWGYNGFGAAGTGDTSPNYYTPQALPSFTLNIVPTAAPDEDSSRDLIVQIVATCEAGERVRVKVLVEQGPISGTGNGTAVCSGPLFTFPVRIRPLAGKSFEAGTATVEASAIVQSRDGVERQEWTRTVSVVTD